MPASLYTGRFAPSPTGPLHLGSLYTALASYLDARHHGGHWLLRIDDLDTPRNVYGATSDILHCLEAFSLHWDGDVYYQSHHLDSYFEIIEQLIDQHKIYACRCSRKDLQGFDRYPGFCLDAGWQIDRQCALRLRTENRQISFNDRLQGQVSQNLAESLGDFVIFRKDQVIAYQFAVVIDDHAQAVSHVVRGMDLLDSTPRQIYLQQVLGYTTPLYLHVPVIVDKDGQKLSKQTLARPVRTDNPEATLFLLLNLLQQAPPTALSRASVSELLDWAVAHWQPLSLSSIQCIDSPFSG